jgi:probable HAF family extracellular repeat protein
MSHVKPFAITLLFLLALTGCGGGSGPGAGTGSGTGRYAITDAGPVDGAGLASPPNDSGELVAPGLGLGCGDGFNVNGCYSESPYVFTSAHVVRTLQPRGTVQGINNKGDIIGFDEDGVSFILRGGVKTPIGTLGGSESWAYAINDSGQVAGNSLITNAGDPSHAFLWQAGHITDLGGPPGFTSAEAFGINQAGQVVGDAEVPGMHGGIHAVYWHDGVVDDLSAIVGLLSEAVAINDAGVITGWSQYSDGIHVWGWKDGKGADLGLGFPRGIDEAGNVLGEKRETADAFGSHATMWTSQGAVDLNTRIDPGSGWLLQSASGVNHKGQISGAGSFNGRERAFLLTPR